MRPPHRVSSPRFPLPEVAALGEESGLGLREAARRLLISAKSLANWVATAKNGIAVRCALLIKNGRKPYWTLLPMAWMFLVALSSALFWILPWMRERLVG